MPLERFGDFKTNSSSCRRLLHAPPSGASERVLSEHLQKPRRAAILRSRSSSSSGSAAGFFIGFFLFLERPSGFSPSERSPFAFSTGGGQVLRARALSCSIASRSMNFAQEDIAGFCSASYHCDNRDSIASGDSQIPHDHHFAAGFDAFCNRDLAFAGEQFDREPISRRVHTHRIVGTTRWFPCAFRCYRPDS